MSRKILSSDYASGAPALIEWIVVGIVLAVGVYTIVSRGNEYIGGLAIAGALAFGFFLTVVELGKFRPDTTR